LIDSPAVQQPPQILALHLSRSGFTPYGELYKKTANVGFPLVLDITDFTTSGALHTKADGSISRHADKEWQEETPRLEDTAPPRSLHRLDAVICHYGYTSSFGHFVAYRRKPDTILGPALAHKSCSDYCECENCQLTGQVRDSARLPLKNWLRISDADVEEVGDAEVLAEKMSAFLLFYEKVGDKRDEIPLDTGVSGFPVMNQGTIAEALSNMNENSGMRYRSNHIENRDAKL
jgi:ubiquitin carboxyl-terminal hydrolase 1